MKALVSVLAVSLALSYQAEVDAHELQLDFPISTEPVDALFLQSYPRLFVARNGAFVAVWKDCRMGLSSHFAQRFDAAGLPVGKNILVSAGEAAAFSADGTVVFIRLRRPGNGWYVGEVQMWPRGSAVLSDVRTVFELKARGYFGVQEAQVSSRQRDFLCVFNVQGRLYARGVAGDGSVVRIGADPLPIPSRVDSFSVCVNGTDDFCILWMDRDSLFASFFSSDGKVLNQQVPFAGRRWFGWPLKFGAVAVLDTTYALFVSGCDSFAIGYQTFSVTGKAISEFQSLPWLSPLHGMFERVVSFAVSNPKSGEFAILETVLARIDIPTMPDIYSYRTVLARFDTLGKVADAQIETDSRVPFTGPHVVNFGTPRIGCVFAENDDIFLSVRTNLLDVDSTTRINDDVRGSNQVEPQVLPYDSESVFVTWEDERGIRGRRLELAQPALTVERELPGRHLYFFPDAGTCLHLGRVCSRHPSGVELQLEVYKLAEWRKTSVERLGRIRSFSALRMNDSTLVVAGSSWSGSVLWVFSARGELLAKRILDRRWAGPPVLLARDRQSFYVYSAPKTVRLFDLYLHLLEKISNVEIFKRLRPILCLGTGVFLCLEESPDFSKPYQLAVVDSRGERLGAVSLREVPLGAELQICRLGDGNFLVMWTSGTEILATIFDRGCRLVRWIRVASPRPGVVYARPQVRAVNGILLFVWSDTRNPGHGFDVFGRIVPLSHLVSSAVALDIPQNKNRSGGLHLHIWPNPTNGSTAFGLSVAGHSKANLGIWDVRGRRVRTLALPLQLGRTGEAIVRWDATDDTGQPLPSGVYLVRLQAGDRVAVQKVVLVR